MKIRKWEKSTDTKVVNGLVFTYKIMYIPPYLYHGMQGVLKGSLVVFQSDIFHTLSSFSLGRLLYHVPFNHALESCLYARFRWLLTKLSFST